MPNWLTSLSSVQLESQVTVLAASVALFTCASLALLVRRRLQAPGDEVTRGRRL